MCFGCLLLCVLAGPTSPPRCHVLQLDLVLDELIKQRERGLSFDQIFGQDIAPKYVVLFIPCCSSPQIHPFSAFCSLFSRKKRPLNPYVTEQMFGVALDGFHMSLSAKERADLFHALGFGAHGYILHTQLEQLLAKRRATLQRVDHMLPLIRKRLLDVAKAQPLARGLNFEAAWAHVRPSTKLGKEPMVDAEALGRLVYTDMSVSPEDLPMDEVPHVLRAMGASGSGTHAVLLGFSAFKTFLSESEAAADRAVEKVAQCVKARRSDPSVLFESMDADQNGTVGELCVCLFLCFSPVRERYSERTSKLIAPSPLFFFSQPPPSSVCSSTNLKTACRKAKGTPSPTTTSKRWSTGSTLTATAC